MKRDSTSAVCIFIGLFLTACFAIGFASGGNSAFMTPKDSYNFALEQFVNFCFYWRIPCGIVGIPMLLVSLIISLIKERNRQ